LVDLTSAYLDPRSDAERVVLAAPRAERRKLDLHSKTGVAAVVAEQVHAGCASHEQVLVSVAVHVAHHYRYRVPRPHRGGEQCGTIREPAGVVGVKERHAARSR